MQQSTFAEIRIGRAVLDCWRVVFGNWLAIFCLVIVVILLPRTLQVILAPTTAITATSAQPATLAGLAISLVLGELNLLLEAGLAVGILGFLSGERLSAAQMLSGGIRRLPTLVPTTLLVMFPVVASEALELLSDPSISPSISGGLLTILKGIVLVWISLGFFVVIPVAAVEAVTPMDAVRRGWSLTKGKKWQLLLFGMLLLISVSPIFVMGGMLAPSGFSIFTAQQSPVTGLFLDYLIHGICFGALSALTLVMPTVAYSQLGAATLTGGPSESLLSSGAT